MKQKPILFKTPMVHAIIDGRKTQTRRLKGLDYINDCPDAYYLHEKISVHKNIIGFTFTKTDQPKKYNPVLCKFQYNTGDMLYVKETHGIAKHKDKHKEYARIWLQVTDITVQRLQEISQADAEKEGIELIDYNCYKNYNNKGTIQYLEDPIGSFHSLWDSINKKTHPWSSNPWVFVYKFEVLSTIGLPGVKQEK